MNILVITNNYPSKGHPNNVFVEQLVNEMVSQGASIEVIAPQSITHSLLRKDGFRPKMDSIVVGDKQYRVWRPYYVSLGKCPRCIEYLLQKIRLVGIKRVLAKIGKQPDVIYGHFWSSVLYVKDYALNNNIPMFVACGEGDTALEDMVNTLPQKEKNKLIRSVKGVVSVSSENKRKCIEYGLANAKDIVVLPNSVDTSLFNSIPGVNKRNELGINEDDFVVVFTGSFIHRKGSARLSEAIDRLNDSHIKVLFIGKEHPGDVAIPACKGICFMGRLEHNVIPDYLKSADVFCLPTLNEGCSNAIVEALSCGLPVISSNGPFNQDILDDTNSIRIDPMNVDEIADAIKRLKEDIDLRKYLSEGAIKKASSLRIDVRAARIIDFIKGQTESQK